MTLILIRALETLISASLPGWEDIHERLIRRWMATADPALVAPGVRWLVMEEHPGCGTYTKQGYYQQYLPSLSECYVDWQTETEEIIGTPIGAIVIGQYGYRLPGRGRGYVVPFVHFYRIVAGRIVRVRLYAGDVRVQVSFR